MLENRGMSAYALHIKSLETTEKGKKKYRLHQSVISKIKNNKSKALQLDILGVICELLDCQPADLIVYESTTQNVARATQSASITQNVDITQSANTTQSTSDNGIYFVNNTEKTILQLLDEARVKTRQEIEEQYAERVREFPRFHKDNPESLDKFIKESLKKPLMTRMWIVGYDEQNKKRLRKRLVNMNGIGWLSDEDLAALDPDELVRDYDKSEIFRLGDLRIYKSLKRKSASTTQNVARATQSAKHTQSASTTQAASNNENLLTFADAMLKLERMNKRKSDSSLRRYLKSGKLKGELVGGEWQIKKSDFENFINSNFFKSLK